MQADHKQEPVKGRGHWRHACNCFHVVGCSSLENGIFTSLVTNGQFVVDSIPTKPFNDLRGVTVQDLRMSESGNAAVARALAGVPGAAALAASDGSGCIGRRGSMGWCRMTSLPARSARSAISMDLGANGKMARVMGPGKRMTRSD